MTGTTSLSLAGEPGEEGRALGESTRASEEEGMLAILFAALGIDEAPEYGEDRPWVVAEAVMPGTETGSCIFASFTTFDTQFFS